MTHALVLLCGAIVFLLGACVAPGSKIGHLALQGSVADEKGQPLEHETVEIVLPAAYGLSGLDRHFGEPEDYGREERRFSATTDEKGEFRQDVGKTLYHAAMFFIPPLGMVPWRAPAPFLFVRLPACGGEYYAVQTWNADYEAFAPDGSELPPSQSQLVALEAEDVADESNDSGTIGIVRLRIRTEEGAGGAPACIRAVTPAFDDFPAGPVHEGPKAALDLEQGMPGWSFRTAIRDGYDNLPVNFAGHYVAIDVGCGAPCQRWALVDATTGRVHFVDVRSSIGTVFRIDSELFVIDPPSPPGTCAGEPAAMREPCLGSDVKYYRWHDDRLVEIDGGAKADRRQAQ